LSLAGGGGYPPAARQPLCAQILATT